VSKEPLKKTIALSWVLQALAPSVTFKCFLIANRLVFINKEKRTHLTLDLNVIINIIASNTIALLESLSPHL
jgi:hypothetical protein